MDECQIVTGLKNLGSAIGKGEETTLSYNMGSSKNPVHGVGLCRSKKPQCDIIVRNGALGAALTVILLDRNGRQGA